MNLPIMSLEIRVEADVVLARQRARQIAALLGFTLLDQTRIATATSEIARNSVQYAGGGRIEFELERARRPPGHPDSRAGAGHQGPSVNPGRALRILDPG